MENSGKSIWKIWAKAMRKLGKRRHIFRAKIIAFARISIAFIRISHCFFPNSPLLLPKFPMAFARIFHGFCPNFSFSKLLGGHSAPPAPPPHTPMHTATYRAVYNVPTQLYTKELSLQIILYMYVGYVLVVKRMEFECIHSCRLIIGRIFWPSRPQFGLM